LPFTCISASYNTNSNRGKANFCGSKFRQNTYNIVNKNLDTYSRVSSQNSRGRGIGARNRLYGPIIHLKQPQNLYSAHHLEESEEILMIQRTIGSKSVIPPGQGHFTTVLENLGTGRGRSLDSIHFDRYAILFESNPRLSSKLVFHPNS